MFFCVSEYTRKIFYQPRVVVDADSYKRKYEAAPVCVGAEVKFYHNLVGAFCERPRTTKGRPYGGWKAAPKPPS